MESGIVMMDDVYYGKSIVIGDDENFQNVINSNKGFYLSKEKYFGSAKVILYSKTIDNLIENKINTIMAILFESGFINFWISLVVFLNHNFEQIENCQKITFEDMRGLMTLLAIIYFHIILVLIIEICAPKLSLFITNFLIN